MFQNSFELGCEDLAAKMIADPNRKDPQDPELQVAPGWLTKLETLEFVLAVAYAISLPVSLTLSWTFFVFGVSLCLIGFLLRRVQKDNLAGFHSLPPLTIPLAILAVAITISGAFNAGEQPGQLAPAALSEAWKSLLSLKTLLPYFWAASLLRRSKNCVVTAVLVLLWISAIGGIWGSVQQVFDIHPGKYKYLQGTGFLSHPMAFAGQMQIYSMLSLGLLLSGAQENLADRCPAGFLRWLFKLSQERFAFMFLVAANFAGLFFAGERSAWLGGAFGVMALTLLKSWRIALAALAAMTGLAGISWFTVPLLRTRILDLFSGHDVSISARKWIWSECLQHYYPQSPIVGIGWLKFPHFDMPEAIVPGVSKDLNHAHSNYFQFLTTAGILGLASYVLLLLWTLKAAVLKLKASKEAGDSFASGIAMGVFGAAVSLAIAGLFEFNFGTAQVRLAQWFIFGLL